MSEALEVRAEILKLARLLRREPAQLNYLEQVGSNDLRSLREQVTEVLFTAHGATLGRLAGASRLLPVGLVATLGERAFGPILSARLAGMLEPSRAVEMASKLPVNFLADVAVELDPRRASAVIAQIPPRQIAQITRELLARKEYVTMGRFVGHLPRGSIAAAVDVMDDVSLLQVAFVLESKETLHDLVGLLGPERLDGIVAAAAHEELWPEALDLLANLSEESRGRFAALESIQAEGALEAVVAVAIDGQLWKELLGLLQLLPAPAQVRVVREVNRHGLDDNAIGEITATVIDGELLEALRAFADQLDEPLRRRQLERTAELAPPASAASISTSASRSGTASEED